MTDPFFEVIDALNRSGTRYVIVGGFASVLHGNNRLTADLDVILDLSERSTKLAIEALLHIGLKTRLPVDPLDFSDPIKRAAWMKEKGAVVFSLSDPRRPTFAVDLFLNSPIEFEELYQASIVMPLKNISARICSLDHLIAMKKAAGRKQDILDVEALMILKEKKKT